MKVGQFAMKSGFPVIGAFLMTVSLGQAPALAQDGHQHMAASAQPQTPEALAATNALVNAVRNATVRFKNSDVAIGEGYVPFFNCVTGSSEGAMGVHFVRFDLYQNDTLDLANPTILLYEPLPGGGFQLTGADYLLDQSRWDSNPTHVDKQTNLPVAPSLMGQIFHLFEAPNRFRLPAFYTLHVWAWKDNPQGTFANWNPNVSCDAFNPGGF